MKMKPRCNECKFQRDLDGNAHSKCINPEAKVVGHEIGIRRGWFNHPGDFDPVWLKECTGFMPKESHEVA